MCYGVEEEEKQHILNFFNRKSHGKCVAEEKSFTTPFQ